MGWTTFDSAGAQLERSFSDTPVGTITGYAGATPPNGWLKCDGSAVSRTTYAELYGVIGTTYGTGDGSTTFNVPTGDGDVIYAQSISSRVATASPPQYVTSLPSSPVDGQTVVYAADASNGVMWTLRYRAASSSSYKWEFIGGGSLSKTSFAQAGPYSTTADTSTDLSLGTALEITPGLKGEYIMTANASLYAVTTARRFGVFVRVNSTDTTDAPFATAPANGWTFIQVSQLREVTNTTHICKPMYQCDATTTNGVYRRSTSFEITPVRVG